MIELVWQRGGELDAAHHILIPYGELIWKSLESIAPLILRKNGRGGLCAATGAHSGSENLRGGYLENGTSQLKQPVDLSYSECRDPLIQRVFTYDSFPLTTKKW